MTIKYLPTTVMLNWQDPSFSAVSLTLHVIVVKPTAYMSPDITTLPISSLHTILAVTSPSTVSLADGDGDHETVDNAVPGSTVAEGTSLGHVTAGASLSVKRTMQIIYQLLVITHKSSKWSR